MNEEVTIWKDIEGNYDIDCYYTEDEIEELTVLLEKLGANTVKIQDCEESISRNRPFRSEKPSVMKRDAKKIDWNNPDVIVELLCNKSLDNNEITEELCRICGFNIFDLPSHRRPSGFIQPKYSDFSREYEKWKRENAVTETPLNKRENVRLFAVNFTKHKKKIIEVGDKVMVAGETAIGIVKDYYDEIKKYFVEFEGGATTYRLRKDLELV